MPCGGHDVIHTLVTRRHQHGGTMTNQAVGLLQRYGQKVRIHAMDATSLLVHHVVAPLAARIERGGVNHEQRGLHGIAQLDEVAREAAATIEALNLLA